MKRSDALGWALIAFLGLGLEVALVAAERALGFVVQTGTPSAMAHHSATIGIWLLMAGLIHRTTRVLGVFTLRAPVSGARWAIAVTLIAGVVVANAVLGYGGQLKVLHEYETLGGAAWAFQAAYYVAEMLLVTMLMALGQEWGEFRWGHPAVPYGGLLLALTWGLVHAATQGPSTALFALGASLAFGFVHVVLRRRFLPTWAMLCAAFIM